MIPESINDSGAIKPHVENGEEWMKASVIICSRNRIESLLQTISSLLAMDVPTDVAWEVIVVDNASQDGTAKRIKEIASSTEIPILVLEEPHPGKAYALNRGLNKARGEFLLFTDDDALVDSNWMRSVLEAFKISGADCVGGKVLPVWLGQRPPWLTDRLLNVLAIYDYGPEPRELKADGKDLLYGVNYAFRREVFQRIGLYNTMLCARGAGNEDSEMIKRLWAAGGSVYYDPKISVHHKVFKERLCRAYFRRWHRLCGRDRAETMSPGCRSFFGVEGYMLRNFGETISRLITAFLRLDAEERFCQELYSRLYLSYFYARLVQFVKGRVPSPSKNSL